MGLDHSIPTLAEVDRIAALPDVVIRNLQITQCYHELAVALATRSAGANWCTFATWASKQAGQTIRQEDFARLLEKARRSASIRAPAAPEVAASAQALGSQQSLVEMQETVWDVINPLAAVARASAAVGRGNLKVFEEIGREFARFCAACLNDAAFDSEKIARFCEELHPGDPPAGQHYLRQAFTRYYQAFFESETAVRAQLMLLANIEIGFHEQTRLQPEIAEAMNAALLDHKEFRLRLIKALFPQNSGWVRLRLFLLKLFDRPRPLDAALDNLQAEARRIAHLIITEYVMTIGLPHDVILHLGQDLLAEFPPALQQITLSDLQALLAQLDPTPDSPRESGAVDWSALPDRLHYIIELFRCYHESVDLFESPFTAEQVAALKAGRLPKGRL
ncbi:hypothetical protein TFLX_02342 [Thermoflexales bacterium]|nr:hypothetical protein TFLX_02342 [Thermoflexales bacterium]